MLEFNFYLKGLEYRILQHEDIENLDKLLVMEFKKAINDVANKWDEYENNFIEGINYVFCYEEQMVFTILTSKLGMNFLNKDFQYSSELITALLHSDKLVLNYDKYALIFYQSNIYEMITNTVNNSKLINYYYIFKCLLNSFESPDLDEANYNLIKRIFAKINGEDYHILLSNNDTLLSIYQKIKLIMSKINQEKLSYTKSDYELLRTLLLIIKENEQDRIEVLTKELIDIDGKEVRRNDVVRKVLKRLNEETTLLRRKNDES